MRVRAVLWFSKAPPALKVGKGQEGKTCTVCCFGQDFMMKYEALFFGLRFNVVRDHNLLRSLEFLIFISATSLAVSGGRMRAF